MISRNDNPLMMMMAMMLFMAVVCLATTASAFSPVVTTATTTQESLSSSTRRFMADDSSASTSASTLEEEDDDSSSTSSGVPEGRNPLRPELPLLKNDFDWDAKYGDDDDWITENVPGKIVLSDVELAAQVAALDALEEKWRKQRLAKEYEEARLFGWTAQAEMYNGRYAMFFLVVGLLTELWTGVSMPGQVEELLRVAGVIGFD